MSKDCKHENITNIGHLDCFMCEDCRDMFPITRYIKCKNGILLPYVEEFDERKNVKKQEKKGRRIDFG